MGRMHPTHAIGEPHNPAPIARFGIVTDAHYGDIAPYEGRHCRESAAKMAVFAAHMRQAHVDFVIELGDMVDGSDGDTIGHLRTIENAYATFGGPRYHVLGNHDMESLSKPDVLSVLDNTGIARGSAFYSFNAGGLHVVVLDANVRSDGADYDRGNFDWRDTVVPPAQLEWLRRDLASSALPAIVCVHQRLDGDGEHCARNAAVVRRALGAHGRVLAVLQGHQHTGGYAFLDGIHYYTLKAVCEGSGETNNAFAVVSVHADGGIRVDGERRAVSMDLPFGRASPQSA